MHIINKDIFNLSFYSFKQLSPEQYRLLFSLLIALIVHLLLLTIHFGFSEKKPRQPKQLDIILNPLKSNEKPNAYADYLAQSNQKGGGIQDLQQKMSNSIPLIKRPIHPPKHNNKPVTKNKKQTESASSQSLLSSQNQSRFKSATLKQKISPQKTQSSASKNRQSPINKDYLSHLKQKIVDLQADLDDEAKIYSKLSKIKYVNASTSKALDAEYIKKWTRKIEYIGNKNYPLEAKRVGLNGKLILAVTIDSSGKVLDISIRQSSNIKILDNAAIRIVKLSAPFDPIPKNVLLDNNALVITRTWLFSQQSNGNLQMN